MAKYEDFSIGMMRLVGASDGAVTVLERDGVNKITKCKGTSIPADAGTTYAVGCEFTLSDAVLGQAAKWINVGTAASCKFRHYGPVVGPSLFTIAQHATPGGDTTETINIPGITAGTDIAIVGHIISDDNDQIEAAIITSDTSDITITASADPSTAHNYAAAIIRSGGIPSWDIFAAGIIDSVGGQAAEAITVTDALATDIGMACYSETDDTDTISDVIMTAGVLTVTCSADPSTTHAFNYAVFRPAGTFIPSHYTAYTGTVTSGSGDDGGATEAFTIAGVLATDVAIVCIAVTDDTDTLLTSITSANTLTITGSADPGVAHKYSYMILRAY